MSLTRSKPGGGRSCGTKGCMAGCLRGHIVVVLGTSPVHLTQPIYWKAGLTQPQSLPRWLAAIARGCGNDTGTRSRVADSMQLGVLARGASSDRDALQARGWPLPV